MIKGYKLLRRQSIEIKIEVELLEMVKTEHV